jgi:hypothetical protein
MIGRRRFLGQAVAVPVIASIGACVKAAPQTTTPATTAAAVPDTPAAVVSPGSKGWPVRALTTYSKREAEGLSAMPAKPTLMDFLQKRITLTQHLVGSATWAQKQGLPETVVIACLLHDIGESLLRPDHGYWGEAMIRPYVSEEVAWSVRAHQALRFYADPAAGYNGPTGVYETLFGPGYKPDDYIEAAHKEALASKWYGTARSITVADQETPSQKQLYDQSTAPFQPLDPVQLTDVIGRNFKQPAEGLGYDGSPAAHMWRTLVHPTRPL